jgi:cellulose synthase/poly-beta-1,6-N-acetylglucosamine synthase-like glycosyltransferase
MIWLFLVSAAAVTYILVGWPLLLALGARLFGRPVHKEFHPRTVTVIIAVHNGERFLRAKLDSVFRLDYPADLMQVIVVSDGSTDTTDAIAAADPRVELVRVEKGGKCRALNAGFLRATGEILFLTDVRQELDSACLRWLVACFADPLVGVVSGELRIRAGESAGSQNVGLYWRFESWVRNQLAALDSMFGATGPVYAIRRELFVPIPEQILLDDMYLPLSAFFRGYRLQMEEGAIAWDVPTSVDTEFGRKVRTLAGNYQLLAHYPRLLVPFANRMWIHYVSYKLGRLVLPWLLLMLFVASWFLPEPWRWLVVAAQLAAYGVAFLDRWIPEGSLPKRFTSPARTFAVMMLAAASAVRILWTDPRRLWIVTSAKSKI